MTLSKVVLSRNSLIAKCMLYSLNPGDTAFTVPLFDTRAPVRWGASCALIEA